MLWRTEATRALPGLVISRDCCAGDQANHRLTHCDSLSGGLTARRSYTPFGGDSRPLNEISSILQEMNTKVRAWVVFLWIVAAAVLVGLTQSGQSLPPWWVLVGLASIAALAERQGVLVTRNIETSVSFLPTVFTAVAFGPLAAAVVSGVASATDLRPPHGRWFVYTPARALTGAAAGWIAAMFVSGHHAGFGVILLASLAAYGHATGRR